MRLIEFLNGLREEIPLRSFVGVHLVSCFEVRTMMLDTSVGSQRKQDFLLFQDFEVLFELIETGFLVFRVHLFGISFETAVDSIIGVFGELLDELVTTADPLHRLVITPPSSLEIHLLPLLLLNLLHPLLPHLHRLNLLSSLLI